MHRPNNVFRSWCFSIASSPKFDIAVLITILLNTLIMCIKWPNMDRRISLTVEIMNQVCSALFIIEAILKIIAFGRRYFIDGWNKFDFTISFGSIVFTILSYGWGIGGVNTNFIVRNLRIGRTFKLARRLK